MASGPQEYAMLAFTASNSCPARSDAGLSVLACSWLLERAHQLTSKPNQDLSIDFLRLDLMNGHECTKNEILDLIILKLETRVGGSRASQKVTFV